MRGSFPRRGSESPRAGAPGKGWLTVMSDGSMGRGSLQVGDLSILLIQLGPHFLKAPVLTPAMPRLRKESADGAGAARL